MRLKGGQVERLVYFNGDLTGGDGLEIEIEAGAGHYLLQVFFDGKIKYESYVTLSGGVGERLVLKGLAGKETVRHRVGLRLVE